jgi:hypothetical protein
MPVRRLVAANVRKVIADMYSGPKMERDGLAPTRGPKMEGGGFTPTPGVDR